MRMMYLRDVKNRDFAVSPAHLLMVVRGDDQTLIRVAFLNEPIIVRETYEEVTDEWRRALAGDPHPVCDEEE